MIAICIICIGNTSAVCQTENWQLVHDDDVWNVVFGDNNSFLSTRTSVYRSTDEGATWDECNWTLGIVRDGTSTVRGLSYDGNRLIVAALDNGYFISFNDGDDFIQTGPTGYGCASWSILRLSDGTVVATMGGFQRGIWKCGATPSTSWSKNYSTGPDQDDIQAHNDKVFAVSSSSNHSGGILESIDNGESWQLVYSTSYYGNPACFEIIDEELVFVNHNGEVVFVNINDWSTLNTISTTLGTGTSDMLYNQGKLYLATSNGVFVSNDLGNIWENVSPISGEYYSLKEHDGFLYAAGSMGLWKTALVQPVFGCNIIGSCNYDPEASSDDGSCIPSGCMDTYACNFNSEAECEGEACDYTCCPGPGCCDEGTYWNEDTQTCIITNLTDTNLDGCTDLNDLMDILSAYGDCAVPEIILGCMDDTALNFNPDATEDDETCEYAPILTNYSMHFSGNTAQHSGTDYITMPNAIQYDLTGDFTIEFWIKFTSLAYSHIMGVNAFGSNSNGWLIKKPSDQMVLGWTYVPNEFGFYTVPSTNTWHHIAICFNDGTNTVKTFIDGNLHSTESRDININTSPFDLVIGREGTYSNYFQGYIDEVRLSNVSRYSIAFSPFTRHESDENTVGLWHFDEGEGSTASDSSSFENDGSITGADYSTDTPFTYAP